MFGSPISLTAAEALAYNSWPWSNAIYDATRDQICLIYMSGTIHVETEQAHYDRVPRCIIKPSASEENMSATSNTFGSPATVHSITDHSVNCHGVAMDAAGNYYGMLSSLEYGTGSGGNTNGLLAKSTDGGATWAITDTGIDNVWFLGLHITPTGRLLTWTVTDVTEWTACKRQICYSDDSGVTWTVGPEVNFSLTPNSSGFLPWEMSFLTLADGRIISLWRSGLGSLTQNPLLYCFSSDDGLTWTPLKASNVRCTDGTPILRRIGGRVFLVVSDRSSTSKGLYLSETSDERMALGDFGTPKFLREGVASIDFGYPALCGTDGRLWVYYYQGVSTSDADIYELRGTI